MTYRYLIHTLALSFLLFITGAEMWASPKVEAAQPSPKLKAQFYVALGTGNVSIVERLIKNGADVNTTYRDGETALMRAVTGGTPAVVELLLKHGADVDRVDAFGINAVGLAVLNNRPLVLQELLHHRASVNAVNHSEPPLVLAADSSNITALRVLLDAGADVNARDTRGDTALIAAVRRGNVAAVKLLLGRKADRQLTNRDGENALRVAVKTKNTRMIQVLK